MSEKLGRFGHHPDPADDFCIEVDYLEGALYDRYIGLGDVHPGFDDRLAAALSFTVGGDEYAIKAKEKLRQIIADYVPSKAHNEDRE